VSKKLGLAVLIGDLLGIDEFNQRTVGRRAAGAQALSASDKEWIQEEANDIQAQSPYNKSV